MVWFLNSVILKRIYDVSVYDQYLVFWNTRGALYDALFACTSFTFTGLTKGKLKALAVFMFIITLGSFLDKALFKIADYMYSDIVLIISGVIVAVLIYKRDERRRNLQLDI